jgi:hypothetical protein
MTELRTDFDSLADGDKITLYPLPDNPLHNRCPLLVMQILASYGFKTGKIHKDIARYCADPCTQILWDGVAEQTNSGDKGRAAKLRAIREVRAERQAASKLRM